MITPLFVRNANLSIAWAEAFLSLRESGGNIRHPSVITIQDFDTNNGVENLEIRNRLDQELERLNKNSCSTVAGTIFPSSMWNPKLTNHAEALFQRYEHAWPGISMCKENKRGVYFRRLTAYRARNPGEKPVNQLAKIVEAFNEGVHRKSALQASIFDPTCDHVKQPYLGFPCLEQITFTPLKDDNLSITGFYAKQLHFEKAYGNYFGLYELGRFMAKQLGKKLTQVICIASCLEISSLGKRSELDKLESDLRTILKEK